MWKIHFLLVKERKILYKESLKGVPCGGIMIMRITLQRKISYPRSDVNGKMVTLALE